MDKSKDRKLSYIREKNHYRLGGKGRSDFKVSNEMLKDKDFMDEFMEIRKKEILNKLERTYKMPFEIVNTNTALYYNDFLNKVTTIVFTIKVKRGR